MKTKLIRPILLALLASSFLASCDSTPSSTYGRGDGRSTTMGSWERSRR